MWFLLSRFFSVLFWPCVQINIISKSFFLVHDTLSMYLEFILFRCILTTITTTVNFKLHSTWTTNLWPYVPKNSKLPKVRFFSLRQTMVKNVWFIYGSLIAGKPVDKAYLYTNLPRSTPSFRHTNDWIGWASCFDIKFMEDRSSSPIVVGRERDWNVICSEFMWNNFVGWCHWWNGFICCWRLNHSPPH